MNYNFGPEHHLNPTRLSLSYKLMEDSGLLDDETEVLEPEVLEPEAATEEELHFIHALEYIEAVRLEEPDLAFGLSSDDS